ncbi:Crossover junction endodeoxyribonuclease RuvC [Operophtera brumata]|uniref:Crossover junction endodeoxyribonuclease RuvC n=1 Tax=Operophtera brumata TaxID=104452 RepID=A0A0L7KXL9_OPEBR|nr:Crossover junction endodeoxyribonuclease RuvC [Operophtera brumata]
MSREEYSAVAFADTITSFDNSSITEESNPSSKKKGYNVQENHEKTPLLRRFPSFQSALRPSFRRIRTSFRNLSCLKRNDNEEIPMLDVSRHKSIDIGVGLARRVSLFLFTRRTVCVHPYHPYTPEQTTRKIHVGFDDK